MDSSLRFLSLLLFFGLGCQTVEFQSTQYDSDNFQDLFAKVKNDVIHIRELEKTGPFSINFFEDYQISTSPEFTVAVDLFIPKQIGKSPLIIFCHGNKFYKTVHRQQAKHLASWGFTAMTLQMPNQKQWVKNGRRIAKLSQLIHSFPEVIHPNIDRKKIVLVGHSFGGSAVTIAAGRNAPVTGLILLDPAVVSDKVVQFMEKAEVPTILLGADPSVFKSRRRQLFFKKIAGPLAEVSVKDATHNDAQIPTIDKILWGLDFKTHPSRQKIFLRNIIVGAFSLIQNNPLEMSWKDFRKQKRIGKLFQLKRKNGKNRNSNNESPSSLEIPISPNILLSD